MPSKSKKRNMRKKALKQLKRLNDASETSPMSLNVNAVDDSPSTSNADTSTSEIDRSSLDLDCVTCISKTDFEKSRKQEVFLFLETIEKVSKLIKEANGEMVVQVVQKSVLLFEEHKTEMDIISRIMTTIFSNLEGCSNEDLVAFEEKLKRITCPKELKQYFIDDGRLNEFYLIGKGAFGKVALGELTKDDGTTVEVAIKESIDIKFEHILMDEAIVLSKFDHRSIIKLLAVPKKSFKLVLEFMEWGDLSRAMISGKWVLFSNKDILKAVYDVASGMEYIADKKYVYRDLACRNVFVNSRKECKIGDFGLCKFVGDSNGIFIDEEAHINLLVAPETRQSKQVTTKSDVWFMGLFIWELYSLASHDGFSFFPIAMLLRDVIINFASGYNSSDLPEPSRCPEELYSFATNILLHKRPTERPPFEVVRKKIEVMLNK